MCIRDSNNVGQFEKGSNFVFGKEAYLETGKTYYVNVDVYKRQTIVYMTMTEY